MSEDARPCLNPNLAVRIFAVGLLQFLDVSKDGTNVCVKFQPDKTSSTAFPETDVERSPIFLRNAAQCILTSVIEREPVDMHGYSRWSVDTQSRMWYSVLKFEASSRDIPQLRRLKFCVIEFLEVVKKLCELEKNRRLNDSNCARFRGQPYEAQRPEPAGHEYLTWRKLSCPPSDVRGKTSPAKSHCGPRKSAPRAQGTRSDLGKEIT
ncbi:hypothetical protein WH47_11424 [Habropoda laboriosa]|uniref:Uncharacterized protein n=1 Tax=Habropoda laboriosa TaxID=597456 RepID=A0A0L7RA99_9HYME|nr:hypothetical protein WH47_11424 [Habropoda laboriosa]